MKLTLNRVHERVVIKEGGEKLILTVDGEPMRMVAGLSQAQKLLKALTKDSTEEETKGAALYFAQVLFGKDQAEKLMAFYIEDAGCVINICAQAFEKKIGKQITRLQKKAK